MRAPAQRSGEPVTDGSGSPWTRRSLLALTALGVIPGGQRAFAAPQGQLTYGVHVSLAPAWFDPGESAGVITPYMLL